MSTTKQNSIILCMALCLICSSAAAMTSTLNETTLIADWAEVQYPDLFSPPQETQELNLGVGGQFFYRYYPPPKDNYIVVQDDTRMLFLYGAFTNYAFIPVDTVDNMLLLINPPSPDDPPDNEGCSTLLQITTGTSYTITTTGIEVEGVQSTILYEEVNNSFSKVVTQAIPADIGSTLEEESIYSIDNNIQSTTKTTATTILPGYTFTSVAEFSPAKQNFMGDVCVGDSLTNEYTETTTTTAIPTPLTVSVSSEEVIEAINEMITTAAGTFQTIRVKGTKTQNQQTAIITTTWFDVNTGMPIKKVIKNDSGLIISTTEITGL